MAELLPLQILLVKLGPLSVLESSPLVIKSPDMSQEVRNALRLLGKLKGNHLGTVCLNFSTFNRIIIHKNEAV